MKMIIIFLTLLFMRSLNRVMLIGHLTADPDVRQTKSGHSVTTFSLATNRQGKADNGEKLEKTDFHRIVAWEKLGDICGKYLAKGTAVFLDGRLVNSTYEDGKGERRYKTEVVAEELNILTWKKEKNGNHEVVIQNVTDNEAVNA